MNRPALIIGSIAVAAGVVIGSDSLFTGAEPTQFVETFDGVPGAPEPFSSPHWDIQVHERGMGYSYTPAGTVPVQTNVQHGPACEGPSVSHTVSTIEDAVFRCNGHVMTAINGEQYGVIYLTPDHMADWSNEPAVIEFSVSTNLMSARDWLDLWVTPWDANMALPLDRQTPDLQGPPDAFMHVLIENLYPTAKVRDASDTGSQSFPYNGATIATDIPAEVDQSVSRQPFRLTITSTSMRFERLESATAPAKFFWERTFADIGFTSGVVQFGHHSYNPTKDNSGVPGTWHWDDFKISPAIPFRIQTTSDRWFFDNTVSDTDNVRTLTFPPAPAGAHLRFSANKGVKVNGQLVDPQILVRNDNGNSFSTNAHSSYWIPLAEGATSVTLQSVMRGTWPNCSNSYGGCLIKDISVWSPNLASEPSPTPTSTSTATATATATTAPTDTPTPSPTAEPPTATPEPTFTATATATPTSTPTATPPATSTSTPTPTATPDVCHEAIFRNGVLEMGPVRECP